ncbi:MAG: hypothetical protein ACR2G7_01420 [Acidimicrobiales bacterium]
MSTESTTGDLSDALRRTKERAGHDEMNALLRGRRRVDAVDQPEPVAVEWDAGPRGSPSPPPTDMSAELRAHLAARRRQPEDYQ